MSALREILGNSQYWGLTLSIGAYLFACWLKQKTKLAFLNPILVSVIVIIAFLLGVGIDYDTYNILFKLASHTGNCMSGDPAV